MRLKLVLAALPLVSASWGAVISISAGGDATPASIQPTIDSFRSALGGANNGVGGTFAAGRREVNWDGVPAAFRDTAFPGDFFNNNSPRGLVMTPNSGSLIVTATTGALNQFLPFSPTLIFGLSGTGRFIDVTFRVPGTATVANTRGFGAVFLDADGGTHSIEAFLANGASAGVFDVPQTTVSSGGFSFLGITGNAGETFSRFRLNLGSAGGFGTTGTGICTDPGNGNDCVAVDDFLFGEPIATAVPEPDTEVLVLSGIALGLIGLYRRSAR